MGALVELLGPDASVVARTFTDDHGRYRLNAIAPGKYQVRASAAFLVPSLRNDVRLFPGTRAMANLTMTALFELGEWFPAERRPTAEPADDWRWVLRSSANRPLLRWAIDSGDPANPSPGAEPSSRTVSETRVSVSSGAGRFGDSGTHQVVSLDRTQAGAGVESLTADLGDPGAAGERPSISARAGYERQTPFGGETRLVLGVNSQPEIAGSGGTGLQAASLATSERLSVGDAVLIDAGTLLSAERLVATRVMSAPFVRIVVTPADGWALMYRFAAGRLVQSADDVDDLETLPSVAADGAGRPLNLNGSHQEIAISRKSPRGISTVAVYQDSLPLTALQGLGQISATELKGLPLLADSRSGTFQMAGPGYTAKGFSASYTRTLTPGVSACVQAEFGTALLRGQAEVSLSEASSGLHPGLVPALSATVHGRVRRTGTAIRAGYRWQPSASVDLVNAYNAFDNEAYLSLSLRQKLWAGHRLQGLDAIVEASNLLEEGYQPMVGPDGQTLFLAQVPRSMQAGLAFNF
jgi:hypothetical protein